MGSYLSSLRQWRKKRGKTQAQVADELGITEPSYRSYESGANDVPEDVRGRLKSLKDGFSGPWPKEEAKAPGGDYITREEFAELRGALDERRRDIQDLWRALENLSSTVRDELKKVRGQ